MAKISLNDRRYSHQHRALARAVLVPGGLCPRGNCPDYVYSCPSFLGGYDGLFCYGRCVIVRFY